jgi:branched-subunit amino acid aminotransferase/4-amino-4-deoxychorismate lyase
MQHSMARLAGPPLDEAGFTQCIAELVRQEADWIPQGDGERSPTGCERGAAMSFPTPADTFQRRARLTRTPLAGLLPAFSMCAAAGYSLYLRPTFISTWPYLGVSAGKSFKLYVITCPVGPYYPEGFKVSRATRGCGLPAVTTITRGP